MAFLQYLNSFVTLFFPEQCLGCSRVLIQEEEVICTHCEFNLPLTHFHLDPENSAAKSLMGRVNLQSASAYLYFSTESKVQNIMHAIKYKGRVKAIKYFGRKYGESLLKEPVILNADLILPVPLHPKRMKQRGYNQSEYFAEGLSESLAIKMESNLLIRRLNSESQTKKNRYQRYENTKNAFEVKDAEQLVNKHVLLVDDVLTTGATVEACASELLKIEGVKVSVLTLAFAK